MLRKLLIGAVLIPIVLYAALVLSGQGVLYAIHQTSVGPELSPEAGRLVGYKVDYFTGTGTFSAVYLRAFGAEDPPFIRKPPTEAEVARNEALLAGREPTGL